jgi:hypothetical protein
VATAIAGMPVFAQTGEPEPAAATSMREFLAQFPPDVKPRPGHGELLSLKSSAGAPQVVRLYCSLDPYALVMLPTGGLDFVEREKTKPTTNPFVAATAEDIKKSLKVPDISKYKVEKGESYLYFYNCSEGFFMHAKSILETMMPGVSENLKSWGLKLEKPEMPFVVIIMPSREAFDAYHPVPKEMVAYYDNMTNYIVMYEDQELVDRAPEFAAKQAGYTIAHEGVHQLMSNVGVKRRLSNWPVWITEGTAEYYCPLKVHSSVVKKNNSELPERTMKWSKAGMVNDLRMHSLLKMNASGSLLKKLVESEKLDVDGYAMAWGLVHFLANKKADAYRDYLADVSKYQPLDAATVMAPGKPDPLFVKHFGSDFDKLEREIQAYLNSKKMQASYVDPIENQTQYIVKCIEKQGKAFAVTVVITTSPAAAKKWKEEKEAATKNASFFTIVCKSKAEAERQLQLLNRR